jgi:hypothetical protein
MSHLRFGLNNRYYKRVITTTTKTSMKQHYINNRDVSVVSCSNDVVTTQN